MLKVMLVCIVSVSFLISCIKEQQKEEEQKKEKSKEILLLEKEVEKIGLNPVDPDDYCRSKTQILNLDKLATTSEAKEYVTNEQKRLLEILRRYLDDLTKRSAQTLINEKEIYAAAIRLIGEKWQGLSIVTADQENTSIKNNDGIYIQETIYRYTIKKSGGLFGNDQYVSQRAKGIAKFIMKCNNDEYPVTYTSKIID